MTDPAYVGARRALLDALVALDAHLASVVLIGAQAIYVHTGDGDFSVAPMTTDADLVLDREGLQDEPDIVQSLALAGFVNAGQPGHFINTADVAVDLMMAPHQSGRAGRNVRSAAIPPHPKQTARVGAGLAAALADNEVHRVLALDPVDGRAVQVRVAGPAALLVAKVFKIGDRLAQAASGRPQRIVDKDALDVLRLLRAVETETLADALRRHPAGSPAASDVVEALATMREDLAGARRFAELAARASLGDPTAAPSYVALAEELLDEMGS
jgi:hypothetical protein